MLQIYDSSDISISYPYVKENMLQEHTPLDFSEGLVISKSSLGSLKKQIWMLQTWDWMSNQISFKVSSCAASSYSHTLIFCGDAPENLWP